MTPDSLQQDVDSVLERIAAGDMSAMQDCMDRYGGLVWSLARRLCAVGDADDAVQEAFVSIWKNADRFDPSKGSEVTFVAMIARRRLIDVRRKRQRQPATSGELLEFQESVDAPELDAEVVRVEEAGRAMEALDELRPEQRRVLQLAVNYGLTQEQIAVHTGMPVGTVKTHVRRGLIRVRELLAAQSEEVSP